MEVTFSFSSLDQAEAFDPSWVNAQDLCAQKGSNVQGGVGPFGILTLASQKLEEFTPVFFRIFKAPNKHVVLLCSDARRFVCLSNSNGSQNFHFFPSLITSPNLTWLFPLFISEQFLFEESLIQAIICWLC